jgi:hypothetical protein
MEIQIHPQQKPNPAQQKQKNTPPLISIFQWFTHDEAPQATNAAASQTA